MDNVRTIKYFLAFLCFCLMLGGCGQSGLGSAEEGESGRVYFLNKDKTALVPVAYDGGEMSLDGVLEQLSSIPDDIELRAPLQMQFHLLGCSREGSQVFLDADEAYLDLPPTDEVLVRAALVRSLTQVEGVECVSMTVNGEPLTDRSGKPVGTMRADTFVDNEGIEINSYENAEITLYFADEGGTLLREAARDVSYNSNIAMEKLVLEQLIGGPAQEEGYATLNPAAKINSIAVADGTCYVDFNTAFLQPDPNASAEVVLYSVVNTLSEVSNINKVQISVDGNSDVMLKETISLKTTFERNLDIMEN